MLCQNISQCVKLWLNISHLARGDFVSLFTNDPCLLLLFWEPPSLVPFRNPEGKRYDF